MLIDKPLAFVDLKAQQKKIYTRILEKITNVLDHGQYILGPETTELEERLAAYVGVRQAITCSSGTDALLMVLLAKGVGRGDAIFTTPLGWKRKVQKLTSMSQLIRISMAPVFLVISLTTMVPRP